MLRRELSSALKFAKDSRGYTYDFLVEELGINKTTIRYAMNGGENVGVDVFCKLLRYFDLKVHVVSNENPYPDS